MEKKNPKRFFGSWEVAEAAAVQPGGRVSSSATQANEPLPRMRARPLRQRDLRLRMRESPRRAAGAATN